MALRSRGAVATGPVGVSSSGRTGNSVGKGSGTSMGRGMVGMGSGSGGGSTPDQGEGLVGRGGMWGRVGRGGRGRWIIKGGVGSGMQTQRQTQMRYIKTCCNHASHKWQQYKIINIKHSILTYQEHIHADWEYS